MLEQLGACLMFADMFLLLPILHIREWLGSSTEARGKYTYNHP